MKSYNVPAPPSEAQLRDALDLELPDWSGMVQREGRLTFEQAVAWNEEMLATFPPKPNRAALDADAKCHAQFAIL